MLGRYGLVGGMPEAVLRHTAEHAGSGDSRAVQRAILDSCALDFAKHAPPTDIPKLSLLWESLPAQFARENKKFPLPCRQETPRLGQDGISWKTTPTRKTAPATDPHVAGLVAEALAGEDAPQSRLVMLRTGGCQHQLAAVAGAVEAVTALRAADWRIPVLLCAFDYRRNPADGAALARFETSFRKMLECQVTCVCAAGNQGVDVDLLPSETAQDLAAFVDPALIAVAACTEDGQLLAASNYGLRSVCPAAPGLAACSATRDGGSTGMSGSSQAAARVAGSLARHAVEEGQRNPAELRAWLLRRLRYHPSLVGRAASGAFLPPAGP